MTPSSDGERLRAVLERAQAHGALGSRPIPEVMAHAREFVSALPDSVRTVLDLGTGAGVPGLVIALERPEVTVTLVDRRAKRIDSLRRAISFLGWEGRVQAIVADAEALAVNPGWQARHDAVVARGFAEPKTTLHLASQLARHHGWVVVSEPPEDTASRWETAWCTEFKVSLPERCGQVVRFHVEHGGVGSEDVPRGTSR